MATVKLMLNKNRVLHGELFPLVFQIIHQRKKKLIYVGQRVRKEQFDIRKRKVVRHPDFTLSNYSVSKINQEAKQIEQDIWSVISRLESRGAPYTVHQLVGQYLLNKEGVKDLFLFTYFYQRIQLKKQLGKIGIMAAYHSTQASLERYWGSADIRLSEVTAHFVEGYQEHLQVSKVSSNTIAYYMRNFRTIYKYALKENEFFCPERDPFKGIVTQPCKTVKRALKREVLVQMATANLTKRPALDIARDIFMFSFYTRGMSFVDIIYLKKSNISEGVLTYQRRKTGQTLSILLTDQLNDLITKYGSDSPYLLPCMIDDTPDEQQKIYRRALRRINNSLKSLAKELEIDQVLSSYVARHSWATQARDSGASISVISEGLGHTSEKTTIIYLKQFDRSVLDQVNEMVTSLK